MSNLAVATREPATDAKPRNRAWTIVLWVLQVGLASQFAGAGFAKVSGDPSMVEMFDSIGAGQWLRIFVGALELAGVVGLLIPALCGLAGLGLAALMVGATITNVFVLHVDTTLTIIFFLVACVIAWGRWSRVTALAARLRR
jgi:uncharacterized membrane protein YphA (DoxX/SURF4 family)